MDKMWIEDGILHVEQTYVNTADIIMRKPNPRTETHIFKYTKEDIKDVLFNLYHDSHTRELSDSEYELMDEYATMYEMFKGV